MPNNKNKNPLFACAATAFGFKSMFPEIFCPEKFDRAYILKGSCGSGKSTLIRRIAEECETRGEKYNLYACSFDPSSLDGIVMENKRIYIADGTSPHVTDPLYPGAVERVIDMSEGLCTVEITRYRDLIIELCRKSRDGFSNAYSFLRAAYEMELNIRKTASENFRTAKMQAAASRLSRDLIPFGTGHVKRKCLTEVYTKDGLFKSNAFFDAAEKKILITDKGGTGHLFLEQMLHNAARKDQPAVISVSPLDFETINALYLPEVSMAFCISEKAEQKNDIFRIVNMARFTDKNTLCASSHKLRFMKKCFASLINGATESLSIAYASHSELERIYSHQTDYSKNDAVINKLMSEIFN